MKNMYIDKVELLVGRKHATSTSRETRSRIDFRESTIGSLPNLPKNHVDIVIQVMTEIPEFQVNAAYASSNDILILYQPHEDSHGR